VYVRRPGQEGARGEDTMLAAWGGFGEPGGEMAFDGIAALRALLAFARTFEARYDRIRFDAPLGLPLDAVVEDWPQSGAERDIATNGMLRVVDPAAALRAARYVGDGRAVIEVVDDFLDTRDRLAVAFEGGRATRVSATRATPDASYDVRAFAQALAGIYSPEGMRFLGLPALPQVFYRKPVYIMDFF
jgi:predicted acetyltransferase